MDTSQEQPERLKRLAAAPEEDIDTTNIPKVLDWSGAIRGGLRKVAITIRLDADVLTWFKSRTEGGRGYQSEINRVLRQHVAASERARKQA